MRVKILNFDGESDAMGARGDVFDPAGMSVRIGEVPVAFNYSEDISDWMGWAILEKTESGVYATIRPFKNADMLWYLYPGAGGVVLERWVDPDTVLMERDREVGIIKSCEIRMVGVHTGRNADPEIQTIGVQISLTQVSLYS